MAHMIETAFYSKEPAWHGLGTVVSDTQSSGDALRLAKLDWKVIPEPIFLGNGSQIPEKVANVRDTDSAVLGVVSGRYKILQNSEAFSFIDDLLENDVTPVKFESAGSLDGGKRVWMLAHLPAVNIIGDDIVPYLVFANSHDGSMAVTVAMTPTRVVCQNTLTLALKTAKRSWSIRHIGDIAEKRNDAAMTLKLSMKYMAGLEQKAEEMQQKKLTPVLMADIMNLMFPDDPTATMRARGNILDQKQQFLEVYAKALSTDLSKFRGDAYGLYNGFADYASHIKPSRQTVGFKENHFAGFIDGNKILDRAQEAIEKVCG